MPPTSNADLSSVARIFCPQVLCLIARRYIRGVIEDNISPGSRAFQVPLDGADESVNGLAVVEIRYEEQRKPSLVYISEHPGSTQVPICVLTVSPLLFQVVRESYQGASINPSHSQPKGG